MFCAKRVAGAAVDLLEIGLLMRNAAAHRLERDAGRDVQQRVAVLGALHHAFGHLLQHVVLDIAADLAPEAALADMGVDVDDHLVVVVGARLLGRMREIIARVGARGDFGKFARGRQSPFQHRSLLPALFLVRDRNRLSMRANDATVQ